MASEWTKRLAKAAMLLGGICVVVVIIGPARGKINSNNQLKTVVAADSGSRAYIPLEILPTEIARIRPTTLVERVQASGELRPINEAVLTSKNGGRIAEIRAREGEAVKAGDILVRFETEDLLSLEKQRNADRNVANAERSLTVQSLDRIKQLARKNIVSQEQLEKATAEVAAATARLESLSAQVEIARTALREAEVRAPFDGVVGRLVVNAGSYISADKELMSIVDSDALEARILVSTREMFQVALGQPVEMQVDGLEDHAVMGEVARIGPVADGGSRFVPVYVRLARGARSLKGGMFTTGAILVRQQKEMFVVPATALREDEAGNFVLKIENSFLVRQPVTVRPRWNGDDKVEITEGLIQGDTIVTVPLPELRPNGAVMISKAS